MPATTPIYELPYQVGTDPPCFGPGTGCDNLTSVWCDFVALVEAQMDASDDVIGRTATAIPMASIEYVPDEHIVSPTTGDFFDGVIPFDTIIYDTDNIVTTPDERGLALSPPRNGVYLLQFEMEFQAPSAGAEELDAFAWFDGNTVGTNPFLTAMTFEDTLANGWMFASQYVQVSDTDPLPRVFRMELGGGWLLTTEFIQARFSIFWHSDL